MRLTQAIIERIKDETTSIENVLKATSVEPFCSECERLYFHPAYQFDDFAQDWYCLNCGERVSNIGEEGRGQ